MDLEVKRGWTPGILGDVVACHARYYTNEWGFGAIFETKVAREMADYLERYNPLTDCLFHVQRQGAFLGSLAIDGSDPELKPGEAHLRWFISADAARGTGIGRTLLSMANTFVDEAKFQSCYLTTFQGLSAARHLYEAHGFQLTEERASSTWGTPVVEQTFIRRFQSVGDSEGTREARASG